jgi:ADP-ribose pyrophosphatase
MYYNIRVNSSTVLIVRPCWLGAPRYVERCKTSGIVAILPITQKQELILVEQFRVPVNQRVIEIPAGLAGDLEGAEDEALAEAANRLVLPRQTE